MSAEATASLLEHYLVQAHKSFTVVMNMSIQQQYMTFVEGCKPINPCYPKESFHISLKLLR